MQFEDVLLACVLRATVSLINNQTTEEPISEEAQRTVLVADLNDHHRQRGQIFGTAGIQGLKTGDRLMLLKMVRDFDDFNEGNDPDGEHNFGSITYQEERYFWKIDYYDLDLEYGSEDPSDPAVTRRILTLMHSSEY